MQKSIISEGKTTAEAIEKGLKELNISKDEAEIKILEEKKKSFFNILDPHVVKVEITVKEGITPREKKNTEKKETSHEDLEIAKKEVERFLTVFLKEISEKISFKTEISEEYVEVTITGEESTRLIGYRGEALNSLQLILSNIASKKTEGPVKVIVDIENYREKRKKTLEELASKIENTVKRTGKKITLEPMTAYERKIIHTKLQNSEFVKTYSIGEDSNRRLVVVKK